MKGANEMKRFSVFLLCALLLVSCGKEDSAAYADVPTVIDQPGDSLRPGCLIESMGQYDGDAAIISEEEAMLLFEEIYEINKYLEDGYTMRFDGNTVEIDYQTCICAILEKDGVEEAYYAATWGCAYWYDPDGDAWVAVGFG